ncbi:hypothetical protein [Rathayibacter rathayi]|uniref:Uncharacterized protein n=1 Tax=Rathayibacter rathayi TaxID=33887 RepID=A0ABX5AEA9_RATRA|nr:hypothetical protein [Rathayibacter rathayi]PPF24247.1 hypothetical protein C5C34_05820 [Rathayibacter rathayi]PPF51568.1 hypothetical protein C5C08_01810 [Rathayibacter rathayi]PPF83159.1 hypothetical protein C5C14_01850 [Rathayibacter rathayi]PPG46989.1 hypothetical protein C5C20_01805 [Rathayibacter rathayi]PPG96549.1 hypothetical protein C5C22_02720 [Rathayibacter rathayi]
MSSTTKAQAIPATPLWETRSRKPLPGGRVPGVDGSMWIYRLVPMSNIVDAKSVEAAVRAGGPISQTIEQLGSLVTGRALTRRLVKGQYREVHLLLVNIPTWFRAQPGTASEGYLNRAFAGQLVIRRRLLMGVKLHAATGDGSFRGFMDSVAETLVYGGSPISDFDKDYNELDAIFARSGFTVPTREDFALANSWWNHGSYADTPVLAHEEHMHIFRRMAAVHEAETVGLSPKDCPHWPDIPDEAAITFAAVEDFDLGYTDVADPRARWVPPLLDAGTRVVSVRGLVEPARVTRKELRAQQRRYRNDIQVAAEKGKMDRAEAAEKEAELKSLEDAYAADRAPATLVDVSVIVGIDGLPEDLSQVAPSSIVLNPMANRQAAAWHETMICSSVRANPHLHDLPSTTIAYSGLPALTTVGDADGALLGFTERDRQPVYISPTAASAGDSFPLMLTSAATGSGKTMLLLWLATQFSDLGRPVVIIDPKQDSDHSAVVEMKGGQVASFDELITADGALDPMRFSKSRAEGVQRAASMLSTVNPWGSVQRRQEHETQIANAIKFGSDQGAEATGQALKIAADAGIIPWEAVRPVFEMAESYPMFRATFGINPGTSALAVADGITLFKVGQSSFKRPSLADINNMAAADPLVRCSVNALFMMVNGSMSALAGRGGVLNIDESWMVERAAPDALEEIGRLARSMDVLPILYTQTPSGPVKLGLKGYMSRGLIGHIADEEEAAAGLEIFKANTPGLLNRVTATEYSTDYSSDGAVNWNSLKALQAPDPERPGKRTVLRGSVFYHSDLRGRIAPVEVLLPGEFLQLASTTPEDVAARRAELALRRAA